jgi:hypothetical protein
MDFEERKRVQEIFDEFWEAIVPRFFPEVKDDDGLADYVLDSILEELKEKYALEEEKIAAGKEWNETKKE